MSEAVSSICRTSRYPIITILLSEAAFRKSFIINFTNFSPHLFGSGLSGKIHSSYDYLIHHGRRCGPLSSSYNCGCEIAVPYRLRPPQSSWKLFLPTHRLSSGSSRRCKDAPADMDGGGMVRSQSRRQGGCSKNVIRRQTRIITSTTNPGQRRIDISTHSRTSKSNLRNPTAGSKAWLWSRRVASSLKTSCRLLDINTKSLETCVN